LFSQLLPIHNSLAWQLAALLTVRGGRHAAGMTGSRATQRQRARMHQESVSRVSRCRVRHDRSHKAGSAAMMGS
jgi:hypothetical protein